MHRASSNSACELRSVPRALLAIAVLGVLVAATICRSQRIGHVPGLNGDEAWLGVQSLRWLDDGKVAWRTPTGNPLNLFHFLPLAALHAWLPPSVALLRLTALLSGVCALLVNYLLCRRVLGERRAVVSTIVLAVLPVNIAYSRFAWDASQSLLATLPVLYLSLATVTDSAHRLRWSLIGFFALMAAVVVHPTNIFALPILSAAVIHAYRERIARVWRNTGTRRAMVLGVATMTLLGMSIVGVRFPEQSKAAACRLISPKEMAAFIAAYADLISGTTVYRFIAGTQWDATEPAALVYRCATWAFLALAAVGVGRRAFRRRSAYLRVLLWGWGLSLWSFYLVAGAQAIRPHYERYGIWLIAPTALLLSEGFLWWARPTGPRCRVFPAAGLLIASLVLWGFQWFYLSEFARTGGRSHVAFRTNDIEPKLKALLLIESQEPRRPLRIVADSWWSYWPLQYLANGHPGVSIECSRPLDGGNEALPRGRDDAWQVAFIDVDGKRRGIGGEAMAIDGRNGLTASEGGIVLRDAGGRSLLQIRPARKGGPPPWPAVR